MDQHARPGLTRTRIPRMPGEKKKRKNRKSRLTGYWRSQTCAQLERSPLLFFFVSPPLWKVHKAGVNCRWKFWGPHLHEIQVWPSFTRMTRNCELGPTFWCGGPIGQGGSHPIQPSGSLTFQNMPTPGRMPIFNPQTRMDQHEAHQSNIGRTRAKGLDCTLISLNDGYGLLYMN